MNKILGAVVGAGVVSALAVGAYRTLLTPQARENINNLLGRAVSMGKSMAQNLGDDGRDEAQEKERAAMNRAWVQSQWRDAGY